MMLLLLRAAKLAKERHIHLTKHIKSSESSAGQKQRPDHRMTACKGAPDNTVFRHEAGEGRYAGNCECRGKECPIGNRQLVAQAAHPAHILFTSHRVDNRTCAEKETGLEKRVSHQVEDRNTICADASRG